MPAPESVRIDKWLWAVRIYKTRSMATQAVKKERVLIDDVPVKPSRMVSEGDVMVVKQTDITRTLQVIRPIEKRVGAKLVPENMADLTPEDQWERQKMIREDSSNQVYQGKGRPTKKTRRDFTKFLDW